MRKKMSEYYTTGQVAKMLNRSRRRIQQACERWELGVWIGNWRALTDDDVAVIAERLGKVGRPREQA